MFSEQVGFHFFPFSFEILVTFLELRPHSSYVSMQEFGADLLIFSLFLDALASLNLKLSVSELVIYRFQLAHLRVFQIFPSKTKSICLE